MFIIFLLYNYFPFLTEIIMHIDLNGIAEHKLCKPEIRTETILSKLRFHKGNSCDGKRTRPVGPP